ncbi:MAG TPA: hypothetical protein VK195_21125 [Burkholderiaceae bacterium]|nr:hypothetical protein [Burkholderiaceae bacterium]
MKRLLGIAAAVEHVPLEQFTRRAKPAGDVQRGVFMNLNGTQMWADSSSPFFLLDLAMELLF